MAFQLARRPSDGVVSQDMHKLLVSNRDRFVSALNFIVSRIMPTVQYTIPFGAFTSFKSMLPWRRAIGITYFWRKRGKEYYFESVSFSHGAETVDIRFDESGGIEHVGVSNAGSDVVRFVAGLATDPEGIIKEILDNYIAILRVLYEHSGNDVALRTLTELENMYMDLYGEAPVVDSSKLEMFSTLQSLYELINTHVVQAAESVKKSMHRPGKVHESIDIAGLRFRLSDIDFLVKIKADHRNFVLTIYATAPDGSHLMTVDFDLDDTYKRRVGIDNLERPRDIANVTHMIAAFLYNIDKLPRLFARSIVRALEGVSVAGRSSIFGPKILYQYTPIDPRKLAAYATDVDEFIKTNASKWRDYATKLPLSNLKISRYDYKTGSGINTTFKRDANNQSVTIICSLSYRYDTDVLDAVASFDVADPANSFRHSVRLHENPTATSHDIILYNRYVSLVFNPDALNRFVSILVEHFKDLLARPSPLIVKAHGSQ